MTIQLTVPNMSCSVCAQKITNAVQTIDATAIVEAHPETKIVRIDTQAAETEIKTALIAAGYPPT